MSPAGDGRPGGLRRFGDADGGGPAAPGVRRPRHGGPRAGPPLCRCRELQAAGETCGGSGSSTPPDEITQYISDSEAAAAARMVLELSGVSEFHESRLPFVQEKGASGGAFGGSPSSGSGQLDGNNLSNLDEIRLGSVQQAEGSGTENREIRLRSVQSGGGANGQNSRETVQNSDAPAGADAPGDRLALPVDGAPAGGEKAQTLGYLSEKRTPKCRRFAGEWTESPNCRGSRRKAPCTK